MISIAAAQSIYLIAMCGDVGMRLFASWWIAHAYTVGIGVYIVCLIIKCVAIVATKKK